MEKAVEKINKALTVISMSLLSIMLLIVIVNVILRYIFKSAIFWSVEISDYIMIWAVLIASVALLCREDHLAITALQDYLKGIPNIILKIINYLVCAVFGVALTYSSLLLVSVTSNQTVSSVRWLPMSYVYIIIPVAGLLIVLVCILKVIVAVKQQFCCIERRE